MWSQNPRFNFPQSNFYQPIKYKSTQETQLGSGASSESILIWKTYVISPK